MSSSQKSQPIFNSIAPCFVCKEFYLRDPFRNLVLFAEGIPEEEASAEQGA